MSPENTTTHIAPDPADVAAAQAEQRRQDDLKAAKESLDLKNLKSGRPTTAPNPPPPVMQKLTPAGKIQEPRVSIIEVRFLEGMREIEVNVLQDQGTMSPRKIEHAMHVLQKKYRAHLGKQQSEAARQQRILEIRNSPQV